MEQLPLVLWLLFYPLFTSIGNYLHAKRTEINKQEFPKPSHYGVAAFIELIVWIGVAVYLS